MYEISVVVPVYKEESSISPFLSRILPVLRNLTDQFEIIFALDPSPDNTEAVIIAEIEKNKNIKLVVFSRRFGQPAATIGGLHLSKGKYVVLIDVDLQDPPELIEQMYLKAKAGMDVVYARRVSRNGETFFKKIISNVGSSLISNLSDVEIPKNVGEFRIMSRRVVDQLISLKESHGYLRGLVAYVGFSQEAIEFERDSRLSGLGNYNRFTGSIKIGLNGLIGFSTRPLFMMSIIGFLVAIISFIIGIIYITLKILGITTPGLATIILCISFFSGIQLIALGVTGEYIGRIYEEVKNRPSYIVDKLINFKE